MKTKASRVVGLLGAGIIAMGLIAGITRSELSASAAKQEKAGAEKQEPAKKDADKPAGAEATSAAAPVANANVPASAPRSGLDLAKLKEYGFVD